MKNHHVSDLQKAYEPHNALPSESGLICIYPSRCVSWLAGLMMHSYLYLCNAASWLYSPYLSVGENSYGGFRREGGKEGGRREGEKGW